MPTGLSIHIGLNHVDPDCYGGWDGELAGCINDANAMKAIADALGYSSTTLIDGEATSHAVIEAIGTAAAELCDGDILFLTYSGHGDQVDDVNGDEPDGRDETWVLYDRELIDDELYQLWSQFDAGVRIVVLSDSCHSGTVAKVRRARAIRDVATRNVPIEVGERHEEENKGLYRTLQFLAGAKGDTDVRASVLLISGCADNQLSADGQGNGRFTAELLTVYDDGAFTGDYTRFHREILDRMPPDQSPNLFKVGASAPEFEAQRPFTLEPGGEPGDAGPQPHPTPVSRPTLRRGDDGPDVEHLQERLVAHGHDVAVDGIFGPGVSQAVRAFQSENGLAADGVVGPATWACLEREPDAQVEEPVIDEPVIDEPIVEEPEEEPEPQTDRPTLRVGDSGDDVRALQELLRAQGYSLSADGRFGQFTASIVRQFQEACGLVADGVVGPATWHALEAEPAVV